MKRGIVFDVKQFAVHDGPGVRTTVFLKGCPLACTWCHNPEGRQTAPQVMRGAGRERVVGREYDSAELAALLNDHADVLRANEGGVTFSGGEPLMQAGFVAETIDLLERTHVLLDTCGWAGKEDFRLVVSRCDLVYFDLKIMDPALHERWTGCGNEPILANLKLLVRMGKSFVVRTPLVPGVTDTDENLSAIAAAVRDAPGLVRVDLLPYNRAAGGKYEACGMEFSPGFDETAPVNANTAVFQAAGLPVRVA